MKSIVSIMALLATTVVARPQIFLQSYSPVVATPGYGLPVTHGVVYDGNSLNPRHMPHRAVVANAQAESQLPQELLNDFYKNPRIAAGLAKESWFGDKEFPVHNRQAEKIPREEIAKIVKRIQLQG